MVSIRIRQEATFIFLGVWKTTWGPLCVSTSAILDWSCSCSQSWLTTKTEQPMTEVDSQCLRRGTTRMPHEILKQLLQTEKQGNGTGAALCVYPLVSVWTRYLVFLDGNTLRHRTPGLVQLIHFSPQMSVISKVNCNLWFNLIWSLIVNFPVTLLNGPRYVRIIIINILSSTIIFLSI